MMLSSMNFLHSFDSYKQVLDINDNIEINVYLFIPGNKKADSAAKSALDLSPEVISIPYTDLEPTISKFLLTKWQQGWDSYIHNKLFQIQPTLGEWRPAFRKSRREKVVISRLRIGHTRLTHSFILKQEPQPRCFTCQRTCTVRHVELSLLSESDFSKWIVLSICSRTSK